MDRTEKKQELISDLEGRITEKEKSLERTKESQAVVLKEIEAEIDTLRLQKEALENYDEKN